MPQIDGLGALDQAARLQVDAFLAMLGRQLDAIANQRLPRQQFKLRRIMHAAKGMDQANAGLVSPDQNRAARHQVGIDSGCHHHPVITLGSLGNHALKPLKIQAFI